MRHLAILALAMVAACADATGPTVAFTVGQYHLRTVNGAALPFIASRTDTLMYELMSDVITLNADGTYSDMEWIRATRASGVTTKQAASVGIHESTDTEIRFTQLAPALGGFVGAVNGTTLTITYPSGNTFTYERGR